MHRLHGTATHAILQSTLTSEKCEQAFARVIQESEYVSTRLTKILSNVESAFRSFSNQTNGLFPSRPWSYVTVFLLRAINSAASDSPTVSVALCSQWTSFTHLLNGWREMLGNDDVRHGELLQEFAIFEQGLGSRLCLRPEFPHPREILIQNLLEALQRAGCSSPQTTCKVPLHTIDEREVSKEACCSVRIYVTTLNKGPVLSALVPPDHDGFKSLK